VTTAVYILASGFHGTLYVGVTSHLIKRIYEHKATLVDGFTKTYDVKNLVWFEVAESIEAAILREKQIKKWNRAWKVRLIQENNPKWLDLYEDICT
jgi:putative endonuclease